MSRSYSNTTVPFAEVYGPFVQIGDTIYNAANEIFGGFSTNMKKSRMARRRSKTEKVLRSLPDRTLHDIGITRDGISAAAEKSAWGSVYGGAAGPR